MIAAPFRLYCKTLLTLFAALPLKNFATGIPEPSLVIYGVINDAEQGIRVTNGTIEWTFEPSDGSPPIVVSGELQNINDQFSYVLFVPCEAPIGLGTPSPDTLQLRDPAVTYEISGLLVNGEPAAFIQAEQTSLTLGSGDRGRIERIDLGVAATFIDLDGNGLPDDWELAHFGQTGVDPNADNDLDGLSNREEWKAGTDPDDFQSQFRIVAIDLSVPAGALIQWSSIEGRSYSVLRSNELTGEYLPIATGQAATPDFNSYVDQTAVGVGTYFYLIQVEE